MPRRTGSSRQRAYRRCCQRDCGPYREVSCDGRHAPLSVQQYVDDPLSAANGGGIVGCALGADEANRIAITGLVLGHGRKQRARGLRASWAMPVSRISPTAVSRRNRGKRPHFAGGIAGTLANSTIAGCTVKAKNIYGHNASSPSLIGVSGIAAYVVGVSSVRIARPTPRLFETVRF